MPGNCTINGMVRFNKRYPCSRKENTKARSKTDRIISKAIKIFAKKGYAQSSVREIAIATEINTGGLYNYIKNKEDILIKIFRVFYDQRQAYLAQGNIIDMEDPEKQLRVAIRMSMEYLNISRDEALIVYREISSLPKNTASTFIDQEKDFVNFFEEIIKKGMEKKVFKVKNPYYAANMIVHHISILCLRHMYIKDVLNDQEIMDLTEEQILSVLLN